MHCELRILFDPDQAEDIGKILELAKDLEFTYTSENFPWELNEKQRKEFIAKEEAKRKKEEPKPEALKQETTHEGPKKEEPKAKQVTVEDIRKAGIAYKEANGREALKDLFVSLGYDHGLKEVPEEKYAELLEKLNA